MTQTHIENIEQGKLKEKYQKGGEYSGITIDTEQKKLSDCRGKLPIVKTNFITACEQCGVIECYLNFMSKKHSSGYIWLNASDPIFWAIAKVYNYKVVVISNIDCKYRKYEINPSGSEPKYIFFSGGHFQKLNSHTGSNSTTTDEFNHFSFSNSSTSSYSSTGSSHFSKGLQEALKGEKHLYAITVTRAGSEVLTPVEIHTVFAVLRELLCCHDENYEKKLTESIESVGKDFIIKHGDPLDYSFLKTSDNFAKSQNKKELNEILKLSIEEAIGYYKSKKDILDKVRQNTQLIVFNEYFFGKGTAFTKDYFEGFISKYTQEFTNAIFSINYLRQSLENVALSDIDRAIRIFYNSRQQERLMEIVRPSNLLPEPANHILNIVIPDYNSLLQYSKSISQHVYGLASPQTSSSDELLEYISYLGDKKRSSSTAFIFEPTLENVSAYFFEGNPIMSYNKSTYFEEVENLKLQNEPAVFYIYLFGCGVDVINNSITSGYREIANVLHKNVSTEICRDLMVGARKDSTKKRFHIIQSNIINIENCKTNIPLCDMVIHADPGRKCGGKMYKKNDDELNEQTVFFEYKFKILQNDYQIRVFITN